MNSGVRKEAVNEFWGAIHLSFHATHPSPLARRVTIRSRNVCTGVLPDIGSLGQETAGCANQSG
jgi:hypothetical protein